MRLPTPLMRWRQSVALKTTSRLPAVFPRYISDTAMKDLARECLRDCMDPKTCLVLAVSPEYRLFLQRMICNACLIRSRPNIHLRPKNPVRLRILQPESSMLYSHRVLMKINPCAEFPDSLAAGMNA